MPLAEPLQRVLRERGYTHPSPIQAQAIPPLLEGRDLIGCAQTGTGKTAAFSLPLLQLLDQSPRSRSGQTKALILVPTRELAVQVDASLETYGRYLRCTRALVYGGVSPVPQIRAMRRGVDFLVATPGRLLDLQHQGHIDLSQVRHLVLDEVDQMLDMGFLPDVRRICAMLPVKRQALFFSATLAPAMKELASTIVRNPVVITIAPERPTVERIQQQVCYVAGKEKRSLLEHVTREETMSAHDARTLVFSRTKHGADKLAKQLSQAGLNASAIHGNKSQSQRQRALEGFRDGRVPILVATDVAARGLDIKGVSLVVNYDLPQVAETYVHRIGRTARANADGRSVSFCSEEDTGLLRDILRLTRHPLETLTDHPYHAGAVAAAADRASQPSSSRGPMGKSGRSPRGRQGGGARHYSSSGPRDTRGRGPSHFGRAR